MPLVRPPLLAFAPHDWDDRWLSRQQLLSRLGERGWQVAYSRGAMHLWERNTPRWREAPWRADSVRQDHVTVIKPGRWPLRWPPWDRLAVAAHGRAMGRALGLAPGEPRVAFLFHPLFWPYVEAMRPRHVIYHVYDVYQAMEHWSPALEAMHRALVERADLITASSPGMARALPGVGPAKARVLANGADAALFARAAEFPPPPELAAIPSPRIGYVGTINAKLDLAMVLELARACPAWQWVFIGPVLFNPERDAAALDLWRACRALPNVHLFSPRPRQEMPAWVGCMEVNIIPYRIREDDWVVSGYPVKLHEYLAAGPPVVAAAQEVVAELFSHVAAVARNTAEWRQALERALGGQGVADLGARRQVALANTWEQRVDQLEAWLGEVMGG